jgi:hypothetical protein
MEPPLNQAEQMLRRVSPEGRALAYRERMERQRRTNRQIGLLFMLVAMIALVLFALAKAGIELGIFAGLIAAIIFLIGAAAIIVRGRRSPIVATKLGQAPLAGLPLMAGGWLEQERSALPAPAIPLVDSISRHLSSLGPQLESIEQNGPGANAIRKLIAVELPALVERYRDIPASVERPDANAQLVDGLKIIDGELARLSSDLANGSFDALATQNRYLQLKYEGGVGTS